MLNPKRAVVIDMTEESPMTHTQTSLVPHLPYRPSTLFDDPTKRIDLFELEAYLLSSRRTDVVAVVPPPDDFDTRRTTERPALRPSMRPVYRTNRDPLPVVLLVVLLSTC